MGRASRQKGKAGEREVVRLFLAAGIPCRRDWESQSKPGGQEDGDLAIGGDGFPVEVYAEVRRRERLDIPGWNREVAEKKGDKQGALIYRRSREGWHVSLSLEDYIELLLRAAK